MVALYHSVRAAADTNLQKINDIGRLNYTRFEEDPTLETEFVSLCSNIFTFVPTWDSNTIKTSTMRLYSKRVPVREALAQYVERVRRQINPTDVLERMSQDVQKNRYSHQDWRTATSTVSSQLEQKVKGPQKVLFFVELDTK